MVHYMLYSVGVDLRYWKKVFIYVVHIKSLTTISKLKEVVPYETWIGRKPDMLHLWIFEALGWTYIPKKIQKEKLMLQSMPPECSINLNKG